MRWQLLGERKALSLFMLGVATTVFLLVALSLGGAWGRCFVALALVYGLGFFGLAAEWFWARWYVMGVSVSGITMAVLGLLTTGWNPGLAIWGGAHLLIYTPLLGESMADRYENRTDWRERYGLDEYGVMRIKRAVKSAATALPTLVFYTLAPREGQGLDIALLALVGLGLFGVLRLRFWGIALLGVAAAWSALSVVSVATGSADIGALWSSRLELVGIGAIAAIALAAAVAPFLVPAYRYVRRLED